MSCVSSSAIDPCPLLEKKNVQDFKSVLKYKSWYTLNVSIMGSYDGEMNLGSLRDTDIKDK